MKVLAILQNQWFRDPDHVREILERTPQARRRIIHYALFAGCRTGRVLKAGLGEEWCRKIVWEEASPQIGGEASSVFPADPAHIRAVIYEVKPTVILALGKVAHDGVNALMPMLDIVPAITIINSTHPTARGIDAVGTLRDIRAILDRMT